MGKDREGVKKKVIGSRNCNADNANRAGHRAGATNAGIDRGRNAMEFLVDFSENEIEAALRQAKNHGEIDKIFIKYKIPGLKARLKYMRHMMGDPVDLCRCRGLTELEEYYREVSIFLVFDWKAKACLDKLEAEGHI